MPDSLGEVVRGRARRGWLPGALLTAVLLCLGATAVHAATKADKAAAKKEWEAGKMAFNLADFDQAIVHYKAGYLLYPRPQFLFNIGLCHYHLKRWSDAKFFLERYLTESPPEDDLEEGEALLRKVEAKIGGSAAGARPSGPSRDAADHGDTGDSGDSDGVDDYYDDLEGDDGSRPHRDDDRDGKDRRDDYEYYDDDDDDDRGRGRSDDRSGDDEYYDDDDGDDDDARTPSARPGAARRLDVSGFLIGAGIGLSAATSGVFGGGIDLDLSIGLGKKGSRLIAGVLFEGGFRPSRDRGDFLITAFGGYQHFIRLGTRRALSFAVGPTVGYYFTTPGLYPWGWEWFHAGLKARVALRWFLSRRFSFGVGGHLHLIGQFGESGKNGTWAALILGVRVFLTF